MPQRLGVAARELRPATSALGRLERLHVVALVGGNQGSFVFLVAGLPAAFLLRLAFRRLRPGVGMLRAGRQRGVLRVSFACVQAARSALPIRRSSPSNSRMIAWASGGWRAMISSVIPGDIPLLSPKTAPRVQINLPGKCPQGVNGYLTCWWPELADSICGRRNMWSSWDWASWSWRSCWHAQFGRFHGGIL